MKNMIPNMVCGAIIYSVFYGETSPYALVWVAVGLLFQLLEHLYPDFMVFSFGWREGKFYCVRGRTPE